MVKNQVQEQRMRDYFIQATKELLKGEGLKSVSVRNVADRAGYSYATMYNYFNDVKDLIFECVKDFASEIEEHTKKSTLKIGASKEGIKSRIKAYAGYYVQYPGIFELFFLEKLNDLGSKQPIVNIIWSLPDRLCNEDWEYLIEKNAISEAQSRALMGALKYEITGLLLFYLNRGKPSRYDGFMELLESRVDKTLSDIHDAK